MMEKMFYESQSPNNWSYKEKNKSGSFIYEGKDYYMMEKMFFKNNLPSNWSYKEKEKGNGFIYEGKDYYMMEEMFFESQPPNNEAYKEQHSEIDTDVLPIVPRDADIEDGYFYY